MKKQCLIIFLTLLSSKVCGQTLIDGIYYNLIPKAKVAEVTHNSFLAYSYEGIVDIPSQVEYEGVVYNITSIGDFAFSRCSKLTEVNIPNTITSIGIGAFEFTSIKKIIIPDSVEAINSDTFSHCEYLSSISLSKKIKTIGSGAFWGCIGLTKIDLPQSVISIYGFAFQDCYNLEEIIIRENIDFIDIAFQGCYGIKNFYCYAESIPRMLFSDIFKGSYIEHATLHVPESSVEFYKSAYPWNSFREIVSLSTDISSTQIQDRPISIYNLRGEKVSRPNNGINVIRLENGKINKIIVK